MMILKKHSEDIYAFYACISATRGNVLSLGVCCKDSICKMIILEINEWTALLRGGGYFRNY